MVIAIFAIILLLAFLPRIIDALGALQDKSADETQEETQEEKEEEQERQQKGALGNTLDFVFGEGSAENLGLLNKTKQEVQLENLNQSATEALGTKVTFDPSTTITKEGIIEAESPPHGDIASLLTTQELLAFQNKLQQRKQTIVTDTSNRATRFN